MLDSILNYSRLALLGIAMAFLINPYPLYGSSPDDDGDGIFNSQDPCKLEPYNDAWHEGCLKAAGVYFEGNYISPTLGVVLDIMANPFFPRRVKRRLIREIKERVEEHNEQVVDTFEEAQIRTCADLDEFANHYHGIADHNNIAALALLALVETLGLFTLIPYSSAIIVPVQVILLAHAAQALTNAGRYRRAAWAAQTAYLELCTFDDQRGVG